jgi:hypothetical protein
MVVLSIPMPNGACSSVIYPLTMRRGNKVGNYLELDVWIPELKLAFEYQVRDSKKERREQERAY